MYVEWIRKDGFDIVFIDDEDWGQRYAMFTHELNEYSRNWFLDAIDITSLAETPDGLYDSVTSEDYEVLSQGEIG